MSNDTDVITKNVTVLKQDADAAYARWKAKGWTHVHSSYTNTGDITLHFQRKAKRA